MSTASTIAASPVLKTYKRPVNFEDVVLKALFERMDPVTRTVAPKWRTLAASLGVCTVTLGRYIHQLKEDGRIETVMSDEQERQTAESLSSSHSSPTWLPNSRKRYFINESVDADWAASIEPQFEREFVSREKRRYKRTKAELDAVADANLAERCRLVMEDFVRRMDPTTHAVAPRAKDIAERIGRKLSSSEYSRIVRAFKAAGLVEPRRIYGASGEHTGEYVFILNTEAIDKLDYLALAQRYRLKTVRCDGDAMRTKTTQNELDERILGCLRGRMSPETRLVKASQEEIAKELGYLHSTISAAMRRLIAEKRLVKVVGKARRGMGNDAAVYRVVIDEHDLNDKKAPETAKPAPRRQECGSAALERVQTPPAIAPRPRCVHKPADIFTCLSFENFKASGKRAIDFDRISTVNCKSGADRTQVFDALRLLHGIAHGKDASAFPALWFGSDWPTVLSISLHTMRHGLLTYSVTLQRIDDSRVRVADERLTGRFDTLLIRRKHYYTHIATKERNGIGTTSFALYDAAKVLGADDPAAQFVSRLGNLWLLNPDPNAMKSEIGFGVVNADAGDFANFVTFMAVQQKQEGVASAMSDAVLRLCPGLTGYTVERNAKGLPYLAVRHRGDLDPKGTPFALLDNAEKILFLAGFVCAMNGRSDPTPIAWLSPFNWLGERERADTDRLIRATFASRGQMIMLP